MVRIVLMLATVLLIGIPLYSQSETGKFEATWESLNSREAPDWFEEAKFGIFIHWGVYSVPSFCHTSTYSEWYLWWLKTGAHKGMEKDFHKQNYGDQFLYRDFAPLFKAELFNPDDWAELFKRAGAKYIVLTSKHHDGYCLWPSEESSKARGYPWNSVEVGPKRDLIGDLTAAVRKKGIRMGLYYSFMEWENPVYDNNKEKYVEEVMFPQMKDIVKRYKPSVFWPDGEWNFPDTTWRSKEFLRWLFNEGPNRTEVVVNDRWGKGLRSSCGDFYTTEYGGGGKDATSGRKPFEECRGIGHSFAFNRLENYDHYSSRSECVRMLIDLVSKGGNLLLDIGPTADGRIPVIMQDRLIAIGEWLKVNGEAIYGSKGGVFKYIPWGASTTKGNRIYLHVYDWPINDVLRLNGLMTPLNGAYMLSDVEKKPLKVIKKGEGVLCIDLLGRHPENHATVIVLDLAGPCVVNNSIFPSDSGLILLNAEAANLNGCVRLESIRDNDAQKNIRNLGYWTDKSGSISWDLMVGPDKKYAVSMIYACEPGCEGGSFTFKIGDQKLHWKIEKPTGSWRDYSQIKLPGTIIAKDWEKKTAQIIADNIPDHALMNLRTVILTPVD